MCLKLIEMIELNLIKTKNIRLKRKWPFKISGLLKF